MGFRWVAACLAGWAAISAGAAAATPRVKPLDVAFTGHEIETIREQWGGDPLWSPDSTVGRPILRVGLANRSRQPRYAEIELSGPPGTRPCRERVSFLEAGAGGRIICPQDSLAPGFEFAARLRVFRDAHFRRALGSVDTVLVLTADEVERWRSERRFERAKHEARRLPRSYENVQFKRFDGYSDGGATVTVGPDSLYYVSPRLSFQIPGRRLRSVRLDLGTDEVRVEYELDGGVRSIVFAGLRALQFELPFYLEASLDQLIRRTRP